MPAESLNWTPAQENEWVRHNASYVAVPNMVEDLDPTKIAVFLRPQDGDGEGISVVYNDNHAVWETDIDAVRRKLKAQTGMTMQELIDRQMNYKPNEQ